MVLTQAAIRLGVSLNKMGEVKSLVIDLEAEA